MSKNKVGAPEKLERNIQIFIAYHYLHTPIWELEKEYRIGKPAVKKALETVSKKFIKIPNKQVLEGAIFAIKQRINKLTEQLDKEYKAKEPSVRNIKELNGEIRMDSIELQKLENIYTEHYEVSIESGSVKEILSVLSKQGKNK